LKPMESDPGSVPSDGLNPNAAGPGTSPGGPGSGPGSDPGSSAPLPETELSSDVNPNAMMNPSALSGGQPQMPQGAQPGAGGSGSAPFTAPPGMLNSGGPGANLPKDKKKKDDKDPNTTLSAAGLGAVGGAA